MRIKVCTHGEVYPDGNYINPTTIFLKTYYDLYGLNQNVEWLVPNVLILNNLEQTVENLLKEDIDILGLGIYVWNEAFQFEVAKRIKHYKPNTIIVAGGPQLSVHKSDPEEDNFFIEHPYIDYVTYGDGEKPFQQIIDFESKLLLDKTELVNIVEPDENLRKKVYRYEILSDEKYLSIPAFSKNKKMVLDITENLLSNGHDKDSLIWLLEFARGCMYGCTFCDWSQNLTKKVKRRTHNWKEDVDLFIDLDMKIRETDANFGMWKEDIEIFNYCLSKYNPEKNFQFLVGNTPKLRKEITEYILTKSLQTYKQNSKAESISLKFSLQDTNDDVLSAINRPSVSWERTVQMIKYFKDNLSEELYQTIGVELILGLPGQTIDHIFENIIRLYLIGIDNLILYDYFYLKNSPAADKNYQKIWGIELGSAHYIQGNKLIETESLESLYFDLKNSTKYLHKSTSYVTIYKTKHMNEIELLASRLMTIYFMNFVKRSGSKRYSETQIRNYLERIKKKSITEAEYQFEFHRPLIEKYGMYLKQGKWDNFKKVFYLNYGERYLT